MRTTLKFKFAKETKGAVQYQEQVPADSLSEHTIGALYVRKSALKAAGHSSIPQELEVTINA